MMMVDSVATDYRLVNRQEIVYYYLQKSFADYKKFYSATIFESIL